MRNLRIVIIALSLMVVPWVVAQDAAWRTIAGWAKMPEGVAADGKGAIYGAEVAHKNVTKYVRE